jgi:hypothetical protein
MLCFQPLDRERRPWFSLREMGEIMIATLLALVVAGQATPSASGGTRPTAQPGSTNQQRFDAASADVEAGRCTQAIAAFEALEATPGAKRNALLGAVSAVRKGRCLIRLGRTDEGAAAIKRGLPLLEAKGESFGGDVSLAYLTLGDVAGERLDYDEAIHHYIAARDAVKGIYRIVPLLRLSQVTMFDHDGRAVAAADEARQLALQDTSYGKKDFAIVQSQYARVLLNEGRFAESYKVLKDSLAKRGGLTTTVTTADIATRSDLAIAALLNKRTDDARLYLAYTGAGRMKDAPFGRAAVMAAPACGEGGLTPADMGIVEFSIRDDGRVAGVYPIYATGGRGAAIAFASAVERWSWRAEDAAKVPAFFRSVTRVELRCSKALRDSGISKPLTDAAGAWFESKLGAAPWADLSDAAALPMQRAEFDRARSSGDHARIARAALALYANGVVSGEENPVLLEAAAVASTAASAPPAVVNFIAVSKAGQENESVDKYRAALRTLLASPGFAADPLSVNTVRLLLAAPRERSAPPADAAALQLAVVEDPALAPTDPLKVAALLGQANVLAAKGDLAGAQASFARTGLTGEQCAQLGLSPARRSTGSQGSFPMAAQAMGFEGWVMAEADVKPDGKTATQRATIAYPPFVFDDAAVDVAKGVRYSSSFRPDGALACEGVRMPIVFSLAR